MVMPEKTRRIPTRMPTTNRLLSGQPASTIQARTRVTMPLNINPANYELPFGRGSDFAAGQLGTTFTDWESMIEEGIDLKSGNPIRMTVQVWSTEDPENPGVYLDSSAIVEAWDTVTGAKIHYDAGAGDVPSIPSVCGDTTAYVGFTGGTSDMTATHP